MNRYFKIKNIPLAALLVIGAGASGAAFAGGTFSDQQTQEADIMFAAAAVPITVTIVPQADLSAGSETDRSPLATWTVATQQQQTTARLGIRFTPGKGANSDNPHNATLSGATPANTISVSLTGDQALTAQTVGGDTYLVGDDDAPAGGLAGKIVLNGAQTVTADTYTVSLDGAVYHP